MKSIATCYSEHAIRVSNSYCSGPSSNGVLLSRPSPARPEEITCSYRARHSSGKQLVISLTWRNSLRQQGLIISFSDKTAATSPKWLLKTKKGRRSFGQCSDYAEIDVSWDLTYARFRGGGPEPISGFYVMVQADSEVVLLLGDAHGEECEAGNPEYVLTSRSERFISGSTYSTRVKFGRAGTARSHDVMIKCAAAMEEGNASYTDPVLLVFIDGKKMFGVHRLRWNFRGNQTIFIDGVVVDMLWDVHDWFFGRGQVGSGVFMLRTRRGLGSRLWMEEDEEKKKKCVNAHENVDQFSLLICACNSNSNSSPS
ncbi:hypothetical protein SAY86_025540 [Trapa natans]|uniref:DUF868 family protein n=1 Tax=Trapa natans TaxID=22666 RepID=A0AAN7M6L4_TRANT|nr:hypothetical protein SAY86_025540 [Trapa natans]